MKRPFLFSSFILVLLAASSHRPAFAIFDDKEKQATLEQLQNTRKDNASLKAELDNVKSDRDNILKQVKTYISEKETLEAELKTLKGTDQQGTAQLDSLLNENQTLKSDLTREQEGRTKDQEQNKKELAAREKRVADLEAEKNSVVNTMQEYTPEKIQQLLEDRNRLQEENKRMATRVLDIEKKMEEMRKEMKPLELDREDLYQLRTENKEMEKKMKYVTELEDRQKQLIKENAEYREKLEVLKGKFKDAVPGLAKSGRISQKMMRENADMHYNLGTIFLNNKQYKEAIKEYERVLELRPNDPETHYNLGVLYDDFLKDREKALYHYQKYLAINPKAPDAKKVETYILSLELEQKVR